MTHGFRGAAIMALVMLAILVASPATDAGSAVAPRTAAYHVTVSPLPAAVRALMTGLSWHAGCPVGLHDLRLLKLTYWGFDRAPHPGKLVVHRRWADKIARVFAKLYDARFPIRRMRLVDRYGANDMRSMRADNTSAFNCRYRDGVCCTWSQHAFGRAIDINPVQNPYVGPWGVSPPNGSDYVDRSPIRRGMLSRHDRAWWAFHAIGWSWGGSWSWPIDYQHFSATNR
ncbi:MAG: M15 family metallopeptidase [Actinomycetota bacterium]